MVGSIVFFDSTNALKVGCGILSDKGLQFLNFRIFKLVTIFEKSVFKVSATLPSSMTVSSFSVETTLSELLDLSEKQNLKVFQNFLLSVTSLIFRLAKYLGFFPYNGFTKVSLFIVIKLISIIHCF